VLARPALLGCSRPHPSHFCMRGKTEEVGSHCGRLLEKSAPRMTVKKSGIRARPRAER